MNVEKLYKIFPNALVSMDIKHGLRTNPRMHDPNDFVSINVAWSMTGQGPSTIEALLDLADQIKHCIERAEKFVKDGK
jgi:hypothetical protein